VEVHDRPEQALSDGPNALPLAAVPRLLDEVRRIAEILGKTQ
jgi:3-deoxy-D-manno-octulosonic acid (KDO) 8-phosphate synthase